MTAEGDVQALAWRLARRARELVDCQAAGLLLGCPDETVRHPLLEVFVPGAAGYVGCSGGGLDQERLRALLRYEQVRALLDIAAQSGRVHCCETDPVLRCATTIGSLAVAPLERPAGVLGTLLLFDERRAAFSAGEGRLLAAVLSQLAGELEQQLRLLSMAARAPAQAQRLAPWEDGATANTEGREALGWLSELDQLKYEFISMVSHELRTPLTAIKGYASLLQAYGLSPSGQGQGRKGSDGLTEELQRHYLEVIMEQVNHLEALAGDLLDVSRIHANHLDLRSASLDIAALCRRAVELIRQRVERETPGKYLFRCRFMEPLPPVWADADRVQQILTNLLENAVKYSPAGGVITIEAGLCQEERPTGETLMQISVCDQGIGISPEQQSRLFRPFSRLEQQSRECVPGVGLGLYITRRLVEAMGGRIELRSRAGEGTRVTFTLPLATAVPEATAGRLR